MKTLIIDNYDSFTYNLYQAVGEILGSVKGEALSEKSSVDVMRNDQIKLKEVIKRQYDRIILSPGPGDPSDRAYFGVCTDILQRITTIPILGVCLGMQGMAYIFGGKIVRAEKPMHGKTSSISHDGKGVFVGVPQSIEVMRYHSLIVEQKSLPECLEVSAVVYDSRGPAAHHPRSTASFVSLTAGGQRGTPTRVTPYVDHQEVMGLRHKTFPIEGVQFHPESFATEAGKKILENFLFNQKGGEI